MKLNSSLTFIALFSSVAFSTAAFGQECPPGMTGGTCSINIAEMGDETNDNSQTIGDHLNNSYAPDSATSNATSTIGDVQAQGGAADSSSTANGNVSNNYNQSSADNRATNTMSNGNINNAVTGGNISSNGGNILNTGSADITQNGNASVNGGTLIQGQSQGNLSQSQGNLSQTVGDTTGGTANTQGGTANTVSGPALTYGGTANTSGGTANTTGGNIDSNATTNSGNIRNTSNSVSQGGAGGAGGSVAGSGNSASKSNVSRSGNSRNSNNNRTGNQTTNVDASNRTRIKHAASTAAPVHMPGYGPQNCFGDTNPSGSFGASIQTFGWGVTANRQKASNSCAMIQLGAGLETGAPGARIGAAYVAIQDSNAYIALSTTINPATGDYYIISPAEKKRRVEAAEQQAKAQRQAKPKTLGCADPSHTLVQKADGRMVCTNAPQSSQPQATQASGLPAGMTCPAGSTWNGKGCWMPRK